MSGSSKVTAFFLNGETLEVSPGIVSMAEPGVVKIRDEDSGAIFVVPTTSIIYVKKEVI